MREKVKRVRRKRRVKAFHGFEKLLRPVNLAILIGALVLFIAFGLVFFTYGKRVYEDWQERRLLKRATTLLHDQKYSDASRVAQQVLQFDSDSLPAFYILAEAAEKQIDPDSLSTFYAPTEAAERQNRDAAIRWRAQIARLRNHDLESQLNLASAALRFGQLDAARKALAEVTPSDRGRAAYDVVAGWIAQAEGDLAEQERHFAAAVEKEPHNDLYQFNLAVLRIRSQNADESSRARGTLERLTQMADFRPGALRALLTDAIQRNDFVAAEKRAQDLQMSEQVRFSDYLLCLDFYRKLDEQRFNSLLEKVKPVAARNPTDVALLMDWMNKNGLADEVVKWMDKLSSSLTGNPPPAIAVAEAFADLKNWSRLKRWTRSGSWGNADHLRLAYQAYGSRQSRQSAADAEFQNLWQAAEKAAGEQPDRQANLARLATKWNLSIEAERLWLRLTKQPQTRREALDNLFKIYRTTNNLRKLLDVARQIYHNAMDDIAAKVVYARLAMLLEPNTAHGQELAKEAYDKMPNDSACAITYAFSLYEQGRTHEGIEVLKKLSSEQLHDPHAAAFAAVLLLDDNQADAAKEYVAAAEAGHLDVEEKRLLEEARGKIRGNAPASPPPISSDEPDTIRIPLPPTPTPTPTATPVEPGSVDLHLPTPRPKP